MKRGSGKRIDWLQPFIFNLENPELFYIIGYTSVKSCFSLAIVMNVARIQTEEPVTRTGGNMRHRASLIVFWIVVLSSLLLLLTFILRPELAPSWSGFAEAPPPVDGVEPAKNLWDWLQLLAIPVFIGVGAWWLGSSLWATGQSVVAQRQSAERELEASREHRAALEAYFESMTELMLNGHLRSVGNRDTLVRTVAQARTLALLRSVGGKQKGEAVQFLYDSGLIGTSRIVELKHSDLRNAQLGGAYLSRACVWQANLQGANLADADLSSADLWLCNLHQACLAGASLRGTHLGDALLAGADLRGADLTGARLGNAILDGADLTNARVTAQQLSRAKSLVGLRLPNGVVYDGNGVA